MALRLVCNKSSQTTLYQRGMLVSPNLYRHIHIDTANILHLHYSAPNRGDQCSPLHRALNSTQYMKSASDTHLQVPTKLVCLCGVLLCEKVRRACPVDGIRERLLVQQQSGQL